MTDCVVASAVLADLSVQGSFTRDHLPAHCARYVPEEFAARLALCQKTNLRTKNAFGATLRQIVERNLQNIYSQLAATVWQRH